MAVSASAFCKISPVRHMCADSGVDHCMFVQNIGKHLHQIHVCPNPKITGIPIHERMAPFSKNNRSTCYVSGFPYKTSTTARFHFSLLLSLQQCDLKIRKCFQARPNVRPYLLCCSSNCSNCRVASSPKHVADLRMSVPNPKLFEPMAMRAVRSSFLNLSSIVTWSLGLIHKISTTLHLSSYSPTLQNNPSVFPKTDLENFMFASGFSPSFPSTILAHYEIYD